MLLWAKSNETSWKRSKLSINNKRRNYHAAVVSAKKHINDCIIYAKTPLPINELNASSENNTLNIETNVNSTTNNKINKINSKPDDKEKMWYLLPRRTK